MWRKKVLEALKRGITLVTGISDRRALANVFETRFTGVAKSEYLLHRPYLPAGETGHLAIAELVNRPTDL